MAVHGVHSSLGNAVPLSALLQRQKPGNTNTATSDGADQAPSYPEFGQGASKQTLSNGANSDAIDREAALRGGNDVSQPVPDPAANANPVTQQAPDAEALVGVATYNYRGQLTAIHPGAGHSLRLSA